MKTFRKTGPRLAKARFEAEAEGLDAIRQSRTIRVPDIVAVGSHGDESYIEMEYLMLSAASTDCQRLLGERLARMHRCTRDQYGWTRDNTIGLTPQPNALSSNWSEFFSEQRLGFQLERAEQNGFGQALRNDGEMLLRRLPSLLGSHHPPASLLHGDLWGGNWGCVDNEPVVFDPAVYFGDRETDLAMTKLFGGFSEAFYQAYEYEYPLENGHERRELIYQLYHVLNHVNLFGAGYIAQARRLIQRVLKLDT